MHEIDRQSPRLAEGTISQSVLLLSQSVHTKRGLGITIVAADSLERSGVVNAEGDHLGKVEHIMFDVRSGRVAYAVLSSGGFFGVGSRRFAVPWGALTFDSIDQCFVLNVDKGKLRQAPAFDKDHWPTMADEFWVNDVHAYYGVRQYGESHSDNA